MLNRVAVVWVSLILLFGSFLILDGIANFSTPSSGETFYVNKTGVNGTYSNIQGAIDNASTGDTIFVYNGTYFGNILINKTINLTGESTNGTIIRGNGDEIGVNISADWVNMSSFSIKGVNSDNNAMEINGQNCNISDVKIEKDVLLSINYPVVDYSGDPEDCIFYTIEVRSSGTDFVNIYDPSSHNGNSTNGYIMNFTNSVYPTNSSNYTTIIFERDWTSQNANYNMSIISYTINYSKSVYNNSISYTNLTCSNQTSVQVTIQNCSVAVSEPNNVMQVFIINYSNVGAESIDIPYTLSYIPKPTNLTTVTGDSRVYLYWDIPPRYSYISNYTIYRGSEPGNETFYKKIGNVMHFYDSNVTNGQTYYYRVCAGSLTLEGPLSNSTIATPFEPLTPITYEPQNEIDISLLPFIIWISIIATFFVVFVELRLSYRKWG